MEVAKGRAHRASSLPLTKSSELQEETDDLRRGPWTVEEDLILMNYIAKHGEGRWNSLARCAGLKRTGKSCRLRWLNYLRPDVKRGNITLEEQLLILELHSRWGNRWSKIAQHLPGRTDNEIKNYWRTRVQKHAKQLKCDVNSKQFKDTMRYLWMPRLVERIQAANSAKTTTAAAAPMGGSAGATTHNLNNDLHTSMVPPLITTTFPCSTHFVTPNYTSETSSTGASSDSIGNQVSDMADYYNIPVNNNPAPEYNFYPNAQVGYNDSLTSPSGLYINHGMDIQAGMEHNTIQWVDEGDTSDILWNLEDYLFLQQLNNFM